MAIFILILLFGCLSSQGAQIEEEDMEWKVTENYEWDNNGIYRYAIDYRTEQAAILVYLRGTSQTSNQRLILQEHFMDEDTLVIRTNVSKKPQVGTRTISYPDKVVRVYPNSEINTITHEFGDKGSVSLNITDFNLKE